MSQKIADIQAHSVPACRSAIFQQLKYNMMLETPRGVPVQNGLIHLFNTTGHFVQSQTWQNGEKIYIYMKSWRKIELVCYQDLQLH